MSNDLRQKTVRAMGHLGLGGALGKVISLASTLVMARLLTPGDYGLMALAMVVIGFVTCFNDVGIGSAIVQKEEFTEEEVNGCFAISLMVGAALSAVTALLSGVIAHYFGDPRLQPMIAVLASAFFLGSSATVPMAFLRREMHFKAIAGINLLAVLVQTATCLALAATGHGAWSLVTGYVVSIVIQTAGTFYLSPWRPRGRVGLRAATSLVTYGVHVTASRIFFYIYSSVDKAVIGKVLGNRALGIYEMAFSLATLPTAQITTMVTNVAAPVFARMQNDHPRLQGALLSLTRALAYVTYPALIGMLVTSGELIPVILGPGWEEVQIPFAALCLMGLIKSVDPLLSQVLISAGHAKRLSAYTALCGLTMAPSVWVGATVDGLRGVALVWGVVYPLLTVRVLWNVHRVIGLRMRDYYLNLLPVLLAVAVMAGAVLAVRWAGLSAGVPVPVMLGVEVATGALAYALWIVYGDRNGLTQLRQIMLDVGISRQRLDRWPFTRCEPV